MAFGGETKAQLAYYRMGARGCQEGGRIHRGRPGQGGRSVGHCPMEARLREFLAKLSSGWMPLVEDKKVLELSKLDKEYDKKFEAIKKESTDEHNKEMKNGNRKDILAKLDEKFTKVLDSAVNKYNTEKNKILNIT